ncbi:MAG TPA: DUF4845 domain-containing protein [Pseudomonadales bacterium]|nr:DUF4845 domain-containing protein [Pseudomonadales bacterium]MDP6316998.1 DUF4845 domain-containing protein [Pseudomonadales bacterium]MDP7313921.1 DUF4845 domain-containing protein [Pseudomonadales bacterium]MDP7577659.1 DUF4845 domain-containing protein [Pseudomonadales bacterium]HJL61123.1 DUF4845 domain-containing protein [Pseudomonadales bacterium]
MNSPNRQRGMGAAGWLILILVFGSIITAGTKLAPFYLDHNTMSNIMDKMALEDGMKKKPKRQILDTLQNRFKLNNIRNFPLKEKLTIDRTSNGTEVMLKYEGRVALVGNVDMIASFEKKIILGK